MATEEVVLYSYENPGDDDRLGELRETEILETERHVYTVPFRYNNVRVHQWFEHNAKGIEIAADTGFISIEEKKPIVSVTIVGSGCERSGYNIVEWWGAGESIHTLKENKSRQLIKRQRVDNLNGMHNAKIQNALTQEPPDFESIEEAKQYINMIRRIVYFKTYGYYLPGSLLSGLYENTTYFRIGDTSRSELTAHKVVVRGGSMDKEEDYKGKGKYLSGDMNEPLRTSQSRFPGEYAFRLIEIAVKTN